MTPLIPVLTRDGLRAVFRADHDGLQARISHIAFGDGGYDPTGAETALHNEHIRVPVAGGAWAGDFTIHMTALLDDGPSFWVREVGIVLSDGTLLAVWSHATTPLVYKTAGVPIVTAFDLSLEALPASAVTVAAGDIDLTLFFGAEFARLGAAVLGNSSRILAQSERVAALESLPGAIAAHTAMIGRIEAAGRQLDTRADELLSLAAQLGTALLGDAGRLQAQGERIGALEGLPGAVEALTAMIGRIEALDTRSLARLPIYPEVLTGDGRMTVSSPAAGLILVPPAVSFMHRGIFPVSTSSYSEAQRSFATIANRTFHLRWDAANGFRLRDLADAAYNPGLAPETDTAFDSTYDDMLVARIVTSAANAATITNLANRNILRASGYELGPRGNLPVFGHEDTTPPPAIAQYRPVAINFARTPDVYLTAIGDLLPLPLGNASEFNLGARPLSRYQVAVWAQGDVDIYLGWAARA